MAFASHCGNLDWPRRMGKNALGEGGIAAGRNSMSNCVEVGIAKNLG